MEFGRVVNDVQQAWNDFSKKFVALIETEWQDFDTSQKLPGSDFSFQQLDNDIRLAISVFLNLDHENVPNIVKSRSLERLKKITESVRMAHEKISDSGKLDQINFTLQTPRKGTQNFGDDLKVVGSELDNIFEKNYAWMILMQSASGDQVLKLIEKIKDDYGHIKNAKAGSSRFERAAKKNCNEIEEIKEKVEGELVSAQQGAEEVSKNQNSSEKALSNINQKEADASQKLSDIQMIADSADELKNKVGNYQADFESFDKDLSSRKSGLDAAEEKFSKNIEACDEQLEKIAEVRKKAESMLASATNTGLAKEFADYRERLSRSLSWASFAFYVSIFFLFASTVPLIVMVVPPLGFLIERMLGIPGGILVADSFSFPGDSASDHSELGDFMNAAVRFLLIFPFIWLTTFSSRNYTRLFKLKEHYAYKRSIAASVEGFKRQSSEYQEEIAAAAFHELIFNPADRMEGDGEKAHNPNPVWDWVLEKMEKRAGK